MVITLRTMEVKCKPKFWLMYFVHRFWRLTPLYMIVLAVGTNLYDHIVKGPLKADEFEEFYQCKDKWWSHMLYFNNFYRPDKKCMTWSWYMSVDMQLYVLSSIFVYITHRKRKLGVALTVGLLLGGIVSAFIAEYVNGGQFVLMDLRFFEYWSKVYTMPYTRMSVYAVGLLLGVAITEHKGKPLMSLFNASIVWVVAIVVGLFLVFINHTQWRPNSDHWTNWQQSLYEALVRPTWAVCVAWVVYACCTGLGGVVNSILSWQPFVVLSRLTYAVYLLHPVVITFVVYSRRTPIYLDPLHLSLVYNYLGNVVITYLLAAVFSLTFEIPTMALEKILLQGK
ncbi:nose resistant to fluoxetine protein 6-like [Physella acuta]|uniref:nose resistant to fluoxetine protein 6-like n=1 Tax=Physella acuta TaxID=109671 RepID=UPI0027DE7C7E|nr:nose resistant to fluoxetine protein 6-like [Physella acuta]